MLAKANAKVDVSGTYDFSHVAGQSTASVFASFDLPIFNRNQGEIARTNYALTQAQEQELSASDTVISDVGNAYAAVKSNEEVVQLYDGAGFLGGSGILVDCGVTGFAASALGFGVAAFGGSGEVTSVSPGKTDSAKRTLMLLNRRGSFLAHALITARAAKPNVQSP